MRDYLGLPGNYWFSQLDQRCTPAAILRMVQREAYHLGMLRKNCMHGPAQISNPFAMNNAYQKYPALLACGEIIRYQIFNLPWIKRMQIEHAIDRKLDGLV